MAKLTVKNGNISDTLAQFFQKFLTENIVDALLVPQEIPSGENVVQTLIMNPVGLKKINPMAPVLPLNSARIVSKLTANDSGKKIAVLLRPCELRALIELVKLKRAKMDNLVVVGIDCYGTYPVIDYAGKVKNAGSGEKVTMDFISKASKFQEFDEPRTACQICRFPAPKNADIAINLIGLDVQKEIVIQAESEKGRAIFETLKLDNTTDHNEARQNTLTKLLEQRVKKGEESDEIDYINIIASTCIGCQNCRAVCPVCYCRECVFEGQIFEYSGAKYLSLAAKKDILRMPIDTLLFHLTRLSHVATTCVACGQCEAACPSKIPLGKLFYRLSKKVQDMLEYEAGRSLEEELPLSAYKEDELKSLEEPRK